MLFKQCRYFPVLYGRKMYDTIGLGACQTISLYCDLLHRARRVVMFKIASRQLRQGLRGWQACYLPAGCLFNLAINEIV